MASPRTLRIAALTLSILAALMFVGSGYGKLTNAATAAGVPFEQQFELWGYPGWFRLVVGATEVLAALALLMPRSRFAGAVVLASVMLGAIATHLWTPGEAAYAAIPLALAAFTATIAYLARPADLRRPFGSSAVPSREKASGGGTALPE